MHRQQPGEEVWCRCVVHIAARGDRKYSKRFTAATIRIATGDAFIAGRGLVPKKGQYAGAVSSEGGLGRARRGTDGRSTEFLRCVESARWHPVEWISNRLAFDAMWTTSCRLGSSDD